VSLTAGLEHPKFVSVEETTNTQLSCVDSDLYLTRAESMSPLSWMMEAAARMACPRGR